MSKLRRRGARTARRKEGAYTPVCNRRKTMPAGMDRCRRWTDNSDRTTKRMRFVTWIVSASFIFVTVWAYAHLSTVPHKYCAEHQSFEPLEGEGHRPPGGTPGERHESCDFIFLLDHSFNGDDEPDQATDPVLADALDKVVCTARRHHQTHPVVIAPKTSPPCRA